MKVGALVVILLVALVAVFVVRRIHAGREARRRELMGKRFDDSVREEIADDFALYGVLPGELKDELDGLVNIFSFSA